jgi:hypothetical protein
MNRENEKKVGDHETLGDITPRAAVLALLHFAEYQDLINTKFPEGEVTEELCESITQKLKEVCIQETLLK